MNTQETENKIVKLSDALPELLLDIEGNLPHISFCIKPESTDTNPTVGLRCGKCATVVEVDTSMLDTKTLVAGLVAGIATFASEHMHDNS